MADKVFIPGCKASDAAEDGTFPCNPKLIDKSGRVWAAKRPMKVRIYNRKAVILDDGDAPAIVIKELLKHLEEHQYK